jgi:hypothetical protein
MKLRLTQTKIFLRQPLVSHANPTERTHATTLIPALRLGPSLSKTSSAATAAIGRATRAVRVKKKSSCAD